MAFGLLLALFGIGAFCVLVYKAAVYALPVAVGFWCGFFYKIGAERTVFDCGYSFDIAELDHQGMQRKSVLSLARPIFQLYGSFFC